MTDSTPVVDTLVARFKGEKIVFAGEPSAILPADKIVEAAKAIHDEFGFDMLSTITAVDYWPEENPRFHLFYRFNALSKGMTLNVRVPVSGLSPAAPTIEGVYKSANWNEREVYDMFGIIFTGHSDLRRLLMPEDWQGHPLRKDYPLGYEEPQFSFNFEEIDVRKPHAGQRPPSGGER